MQRVTDFDLTSATFWRTSTRFMVFGKLSWKLFDMELKHLSDLRCVNLKIFTGWTKLIGGRDE